MNGLPDPIKVSPFIRFARWSLLIFGIFYGSTRQKFLAAREVGIREEEARKKVIRDARLKEERRISSERDVEMIGRMIVPESYVYKPPPPIIVYVPVPGAQLPAGDPASPDNLQPVTEEPKAKEADFDDAEDGGEC